MHFEQDVLYTIESKVVTSAGFIPLTHIFTSCAFYIVAVVQETARCCVNLRVSVVHAGVLKSRGLIPGRGKRFVFSPKSYRLGLGPTQLPTQWALVDFEWG